MDGGSFRPAEDFGYVRATAMMNSKSSNDFRWSVRITDDVSLLCLGIASNEFIQNELPEADENMFYNDKNAIVYYPYAGIIQREMKLIQQMTTNVTSGDEIHFRFQPKMKKFLISVVS